MVENGRSIENFGLSNAEAAKRRARFGINALPAPKPKTAWRRVWGIVSEPMMILLVATSVIYFFVGDTVQGMVIFASIIPITIIEFFQEKRTDTALAALNTLRVEQCKVYRDGALVEMKSVDLVPGDVLYLTAGDKVPADARVDATPGVMIDESILTGESAPVEKVAGGVNASKKSFIYQSTMVVQGEARATVTATGQSTEYGKLGKLLEMIEIKTTPLQARIESLVKKLAVAAVAIALLIGVVLASHFGITHGLLAALTVAIAIIPEEFPIVFSVFLIMGVMRMTRRRAVVRQMALVETLGSATIICTDKTGTLTQGNLQLVAAYANGARCEASQEGGLKQCEQLIFDALLAVEQVATDPIEIEVQRLARQLGSPPENIFSTYILRHDGSFDAKSKLVQHAWESPTGEVVQYVAGAPESVIDRASLDQTAREAALKMYQDFARQGYRVIGIAKKKLDHDETRAHQETFVDKGWELSGLLAMVDPPRPGVKQAVAAAYEAGIKLMMITGDNELTAAHLARTIGLKVTKPAVHGDELENMPPEKFREIVRDATIFTRVRPEQKYLIVEALQNNKEVVAMTGDGVNDAPALKKADIGIAMGERGTEVARAAAGMILLDDNFSTIMAAVEEGRRMYDNLRRAFVFLFSLHIPIVGMAVVPLFLGQDLFFMPIQIIFLELFGDPAAVIGFERDKLRHGAMQAPPRPVNERLIMPRLWWLVAVYGVSIFLVTLAWHLGTFYTSGNFELARTVAFVALVFAQITLVLFSREWAMVKTNKVLTTIAAITLSALTAFTFIPSVNHVFGFVPITVGQYATAALSATAAMFVVSRLGRRIVKV